MQGKHFVFATVLVGQFEDLGKVIKVFLFADAYDALDPNGNITIKWDVISWTPDGYVVSISK